MKKSTIVIVFSAVIVLILGAGAAGSYYLNTQMRTTRADLKERIEELEGKKDDLEADITTLKMQNKEARKKIEELEDEAKRKKQTPAKMSASEKDLITQAISAAVREMGHNPSEFDIIDIAYKNGWASGRVHPENPTMETEFFVLQKKNGTWTVINSGTGLDHSDYPDSPAEIWP